MITDPLMKAKRQEIAQLHFSKNLTAKILDAVRGVAIVSLAISPDHEQIVQLIPPGSETHGMLCEYGLEKNPNMVQEVVDALAIALVGREVPGFYEVVTRKEMELFFKSVKDEAVKRKILTCR